MWIILALLAFVIGLGVWAVFRERSFRNGLFFWQRLSLYKRGARATGKVLKTVRVAGIASGTPTDMEVDLTDIVVAVTTEDGASWEATLRYTLDPITQKLGVGKSIPLRYDPAHRPSIIIDWRALQ